RKFAALIRAETAWAANRAAEWLGYTPVVSPSERLSYAKIPCRPFGHSGGTDFHHTRRISRWRRHPDAARTRAEDRTVQERHLALPDFLRKARLHLQAG